MVTIESKGAAYAYDLQALVKAFYPGEEILVKEEAAEPACGKFIKVSLSEEQIGISFWENGIPILEKASRPAFGQGTQWLGQEGSLEDAKKKQYKNELKMVLYKLLREITGRELPWGTLTGVRPTKIPMALYLDGSSLEEIGQSMKERYLCREDKIAMAAQIVEKEAAILREIDYAGGYSVYIGIPFCPTTCSYCSFTSFPFEKNRCYAEGYMEALFREIDYGASCIKAKKLSTLYIGGGTPTALDEAMLERLLVKIRDSFPMELAREFTVEAGRPDSITREKLSLMKSLGVTRISINPQTMKEATLRQIGRNHTALQVKEAFALAREEGHRNINMDLIAGLPGETLEDMAQTLEEIKQLSPDSITIHSLVTKRAARMNLQKGEQEEDSGADVDAMTEYGYQFCQKNGYLPYYMYRQKNAAKTNRSSSQENIGYAKEGKEGIYNILMMEEIQPILALGAGASSKFVIPEAGLVGRVENVKSLPDYIARIDEMIDRKRSFLEKNPL